MNQDQIDVFTDRRGRSAYAIGLRLFLGVALAVLLVAIFEPLPWWAR